MKKITEGFASIIFLQLENAPTNSQLASEMPTDAIRILKTHALPKFLPDAITDDPKAKVIYVARNPKDTVVSYYHFSKYIVTMPNYASWDEFFEEFIADRGSRCILLYYQFPLLLHVK